jgi:ABC-type transport system substrate-binding protein
MRAVVIAAVLAANLGLAAYASAQQGAVTVGPDEVERELVGRTWIVKGDLLHTGYVTMNTTQAPFDNKLVRQAVNMAINKERVVRIVNGRGSAANQPLPPADAWIRPELPGLCLRSRESPGAARRGRSSQLASRPSSTP